jgi:hypothetical protein
VKLFLAIDHILPNLAQIDQILFPIFLATYGHLISKFNAELKSFYRIQFAYYSNLDIQIYSARPVKANCKTQYSRRRTCRK